MDLKKLFEIQKVLRDRINYNEPDRFNKLVLALLVELGECANEWRGFKFWSVNQLPHTSAVRVPCMMDEDKEFYNPLLEEYVDGLHFVFEIGIEIAEEIQFDVEDYFKEIADEIRGKSQKSRTITEQFSYIFYLTTSVNYDFNFPYLFAAYYHLGEMLGFTWEQIEQAYFEKNKINHQRQESGY
ncbi:dUTP diphosphatase [Bacillus sp. JJ1503]|uniref:dUTP diphosphatase n=1 Tax=Bacillus sp. JJ1503 TaxID=3122956 RepID=UPI002FFDFD38